MAVQGAAPSSTAPARYSVDREAGINDSNITLKTEKLSHTW